MTSDIASRGSGQASPFFPGAATVSVSPPAALPARLADRVAAVPGMGRAAVVTASPSELAATLQGLVAALKRQTPAELQGSDLHGDGSLQITSHLAVWLIGQITEVYGSRLVKLSGITDLESLRSLNGVAQLLHDAIRAKPARQR